MKVFVEVVGNLISLVGGFVGVVLVLLSLFAWGTSPEYSAVALRLFLIGLALFGVSRIFKDWAERYLW